MKHYNLFLAILAALFVAMVCSAGRPAGTTVASAPAVDTFTYNLPCQVINIHSELPGKAIMLLWLHGGVRHRAIHSYFTHPNHWDNCAADDSIVNYLNSHNIKAVALLPMCHRADAEGCIAWRDCYADVKVMIDEYVSRGLVDPARIYLAGSSDGGRGAWDYAAEHPEMFAAAISMSCEEPRMVSIPVYFFSTAAEGDCSEQVAVLQAQGATIVEYEYCREMGHGGDAARCTPQLLDRFFAHRK